MKGLFWNSRGLRDLAKYKFLFDTSCDHQLDFIAILETRRDDFTTFDFNHFCGGRDFFGIGLHLEDNQVELYLGLIFKFLILVI